MQIERTESNQTTHLVKHSGKYISPSYFGILHQIIPVGHGHDHICTLSTSNSIKLICMLTNIFTTSRTSDSGIRVRRYDANTESADVEVCLELSWRLASQHSWSCYKTQRSIRIFLNKLDEMLTFCSFSDPLDSDLNSWYHRTGALPELYCMNAETDACMALSNL